MMGVFAGMVVGGLTALILAVIWRELGHIAHDDAAAIAGC